MKTEYKVICAHQEEGRDIHETLLVFQRRVNSLIDKGWQPLGGMNHAGYMFTQAMIKDAPHQEAIKKAMEALERVEGRIQAGIDGAGVLPELNQGDFTPTDKKKPEITVGDKVYVRTKYLDSYPDYYIVEEVLQGGRVRLKGIGATVKISTLELVKDLPLEEEYDPQKGAQGLMYLTLKEINQMPCPTKGYPATGFYGLFFVPEMCCAPNCPAWRWQVLHESEAGDKIYSNEKGHCGLGGRPC